jgi:hypothetical protein
MTSTTVSAVQEAVEALNRAMVSGDRAELDKWTAEDLIYGHANARRENKQQFIAALAGADSRFAEIVASDRTVTLIDNVALVYQAIERTRPGGNPSNMKDLGVWMLRGGQWKLVARQSVRS